MKEVDESKIPDSQGGRIAWLRKEVKGWTQPKLAELVGLSTSQISGLELNSNQSSRQMHRIIRVLDTTPEFISDGTLPWRRADADGMGMDLDARERRIIGILRRISEKDVMRRIDTYFDGLETHLPTMPDDARKSGKIAAREGDVPGPKIVARKRRSG